MKCVSCREEILTLRDGIDLLSKIWVPKEGGPWPALLMRQPYGREIASTVTYLHPAWWASQGYIVIIQDVRGQGGSGGEFLGFKQESTDTSQTHAWVRTLPECNGKLGTYGFSYQGLTQLIAEPGTPPPDCLAPAMTGLNECAHWSCDGGAYWWHLGISWGLQIAALKARKAKDYKAWEKIRRSLENGSYLRKGHLLLKSYDPEGMAIQWLENSSHENHPDWLIHKPLKTWLRTPMLLIGGWWDPHLKGILDIYKQSTEAGGEPELHIGPANHLQWWENSQQLHLNFFNRHLKSTTKTNSQKLSKKIIWNLTKKCWQTPSKSRSSNGKIESTWGLKSNGMACIDSKDGILVPESNGEGLIHLVHDPWRPVPSIGGHLSPQPGEAERNEIDQRADVATFTTKPLEHSIQLEGIPSLEIVVEADRKGFDICVALSVVEKSQKKVKQLSTGFLRVLGDHSKLCIPRKILLQPMLAELSQGDCLRISIAGSAWPAIGINPGDGHKVCGPTDAECNVVTLKMHLVKSKLHFDPLLND